MEPLNKNVPDLTPTPFPDGRGKKLLMKELFFEVVADKETLEEIYAEVVDIFRSINRGKSGRIGYVSGIIGSDGPEHVDRNFERLAAYTQHLKKLHEFPVFSATEIFTPLLLDSLRQNGASGDHFITFWRSVLGSGHVTDVFLTPRWQASVGANDEYEIARKLGLRLHYVDDNLLSNLRGVKVNRARI